jgi:2-methylisocitrate lyase-like PEP mutase family enzyme
MTAQLFRSLHDKSAPLLLPNAWDAASARIAEAAGAQAIATTSAGVAWSLGVPDGGYLDRDLVVGVVTRIVAAVNIPVTADIENGYADVADTVAAVVAAGAIGVNLEDGDLPPEEHCERIRTARKISDLFINARIDTYLRGLGDPSTRLDATVERATACIAAGADGVFVPGVTDPETVSELATRIDAPLNVMAGPGAPTVAELTGLGVARISLGSAIAQAAYAIVQQSTVELLASGTYTAVRDPLDYGTLNGLFA